MTKPAKHIPLKDLIDWDGNVRTTEGSDTGLAELAASIQSVGIINPLTVFAKGKKFAVVAGKRRLAALHHLVKGKLIEDSYEVSCTLTSEEQATEISLAENVIREDMHPADEFEAFLKLSNDGVSNEDIAAKFGYTPGVVAKRLKLANVSPKIMAAYRRNEIGLDCVMAYAVTDDVKRQEKLFKSLSGYRATDADTIRGALTDGEVDATDKRVRFVTLKAYEKAGGKTRRDLFADEDDASGIYILDVPLLEELVSKKLEKAASAVRKEGWNWVETRSDFDYETRSRFKQLREEPVPLSDELQQEIDRLTGEHNVLYDTEEELTDEQSARVDEIETRIGEIEDGQETAWPEGTFGVAGAIVAPGSDGKADVTRGLVRPADVKNLPKRDCAAVDPDSDAHSGPNTPSGNPGLPAKLAEQLTRHRTAALAAELVMRPGIGLAIVAYNLAAPIFTGDGNRSCVHISINKHSGDDFVAETRAGQELERQRSTWGDMVPGTPQALWTWCRQQERDDLIRLITFCAASALDAIVRKRGSLDRRTDLAHADVLAAELCLDMSKWFSPTAENYFAHVSKAQIIEALAEAKGLEPRKLPPAWHKAKKADLASIAEREAAQANWLPAILRMPDPSAQEVKKAA